MTVTTVTCIGNEQSHGIYKRTGTGENKVSFHHGSEGLGSGFYIVLSEKTSEEKNIQKKGKRLGDFDFNPVTLSGCFFSCFLSSGRLSRLVLGKFRANHLDLWSLKMQCIILFFSQSRMWVYNRLLQAYFRTRVSNFCW